MINLKEISAKLQNGKRPDCPRCKLPESALVYEDMIIEDFVCGKCFMELRDQKKQAIKKIIQENYANTNMPTLSNTNNA